MGDSVFVSKFIQKKIGSILVVNIRLYEDIIQKVHIFVCLNGTYYKIHPECCETAMNTDSVSGKKILKPMFEVYDN